MKATAGRQLSHSTDSSCALRRAFVASRETTRTVQYCCAATTFSSLCPIKSGRPSSGFPDYQPAHDDAYDWLDGRAFATHLPCFVHIQ